jgi:GAF domain-containing protein
MSDANHLPLNLYGDLESDEELKATDLDFYNLLRRNSGDGSIYFNQRRAVIFDTDAIGLLRRQLVATLGMSRAMGALMRFGYAHGQQAAATLSDVFNWASDTDYLTAGPMLHMLEGVVKTELHQVEFDRDTGHFFMQGTWHNSYEAAQHLKHFGQSDDPVCATLAGYASGYASQFLGRKVLAVETACVGRGDLHCAWEMRLSEAWSDDITAVYRQWLEPVSIADEQQLARNDLVKEEITEHKEAQQALAKRALELETVSQVSIDVASVFEPKQLLKQVADLTKDRFGLYHAHIYLLNRRGNLLELAAGAGEVGRKMVNQGWQISLDNLDSLVAHAARTKAGVIENDIVIAPRHLPNPLLPDTRAEMAVPLIAGDELLGVLDVQADSTNYFTHDDVRVHTTLAAQVAVAIQNSRLFHGTQTALAQTEALYQITRNVSAVDTLLAVLQTTATGAVQAIGADRVLVFAIDAENRRVIEYAGDGPGMDRIPQPELPAIYQELYSGMAGQALRTRKSILSTEGIIDPRTEMDVYWLRHDHNIGTLLITPIYYRNVPMGVIIITNRLEQPVFDQGDVDFVDNLANQVAAAIQTRLLLAQMRDTLAELKATQRRYTVQAWDTYLSRAQAHRYELAADTALPPPDFISGPYEERHGSDRSGATQWLTITGESFGAAENEG